MFVITAMDCTRFGASRRSRRIVYKYGDLGSVDPNGWRQRGSLKLFLFVSYIVGSGTQHVRTRIQARGSRVNAKTQDTKAPILFHFFEKHPKVAGLILRWEGCWGTGDAPAGAAQ